MTYHRGVLVAFLLILLCGVFAWANETPKEHELGAATVQFANLDPTEFQPSKGFKWDNRPGGLHVIGIQDAARVLFDTARGTTPATKRTTATLFVPSNGFMLIGRLPGLGTGPHNSYQTKLVRVTKFVRKSNQIVLHMDCEFDGPYFDAEPVGRSVYFLAPVANIPTGVYTAIVKITPTGRVFREFKDAEIRLPEFPPMKWKFKVVHPKDSLLEHKR